MMQIPKQETLISITLSMMNMHVIKNLLLLKVNVILRDFLILFLHTMASSPKMQDLFGTV